MLTLCGFYVAVLIYLK